MIKCLGMTAVVAAAIGMSSDLSLTTQFAANNSFAGNTFDLEVLNPQGVQINGWDINLDSPNPTETVDIWWRNGTAVGNENNAAGWMLIGTDTGVVAQGLNNPTPVDVGEIVLDPGTYGIYVDLVSYQGGINIISYTNGGPTVYANADLSLTTNTGENDGVFTGGSFFRREWNGTIHYEIASVPDSDGDGIPDDEDDCPFSDLSGTIVANGCDSGVENVLFPDGCTMADLLGECDENSNHGQHVSCVAHLTNTWVADELITGAEKGAIQSCFAQSGAGQMTTNAIVPCLEDLNLDGQVGAADLLALLSAWGGHDMTADFNRDGEVGSADLLHLLAHWGPCTS